MISERKTRWPTVALAVIAGVVVACQVGKVPPSLPVLRADLGVGMIQAGWIASLFNATSAALGAVAGLVADRVGYRRSVLVGLGYLAAGSLIGGLAPNGSILLVSRFIEGIGFVTVVVAAPSIIAASTQAADRRLALGAWGAYMPAGMAIMMLATPPLMATVGWRGLWIFNAALLVVFAMVFVAATPAVGRSMEPRRSLADVRAILVRPGPWLLATCFATYSLQWFGLLAWLPTFLVETTAIGATRATIVAAAVVGINVAGNLAGGWLLHRGVRRWRLIVLASMTMGICAFSIYVLALGPLAKIGLAFAFSLVGGVLPASILSSVPVHSPSPDKVGVTNGIIVQGANVGTLVGPPLVAVAVQLSGDWRSPGWLLLASGLAGILLALALRAAEGKRPARMQ